MTDLGVEVALSDFWPELHLFDGDMAGLLARLLGLLRLFVPELAVVHDAAHGRIGLWRNFDQIEIQFASQRESVGCGTNSYLASIGSDEANLARTNALVVAGFIGWRSYDLLLLSNGTCPPLCRPADAGCRVQHEADIER